MWTSFGLLDEPVHHALFADHRARPGERRPDLEGHRHAVLGLFAGDAQRDGKGAGLADVLRDLQGVDVVLGLDGRAGDDDGAGVLLDGELDVPAELPAAGGGVRVEGAAVVPVHLLAEELAAEALLSVVADPGERQAAHDRRMTRQEGDHRDSVGTLAPHDGAHPLAAGHRLAPHGCHPSLVIFMSTSSGSASPAATSTALISALGTGQAACAQHRVGRLEQRTAGPPSAPIWRSASTSIGSGSDLLYVGAVALELEIRTL